MGESGLIARNQAPAWLARPGNRLAVIASGIGLERWGRIGALAITPLLLTGSERAPFLPLFLGLAGYVLLTALARRDRFLRSADLAVSAALILLTGPQLVGFLPFLLVTVAGPAAAGGLGAGLAGGGTLALVAVVRYAAGGALDEAGLASLLPVVLLLLLTGVATATAAQVLEDRAVHDRLVLERANRLLSALRDIAGDIPGGLDAATVSAALTAELRGIAGLQAAVVLVEENGLLRATGAIGLDRRLPAPVPAGALSGRGTRLLGPTALPPELVAGTGGHPHWWVVPVGDPRTPAGVLLAGFDDAAAATDSRPGLVATADHARLALENARLLDGAQTRAADAARRRVASDLHDGVAQALTHLRMELELLAREDRSDDAPLGRLARVATRALTDLRATIDGLRTPADGDLHGLLARYVDDVRASDGPAVELVRSDPVTLPPGHALEVLRVAQEAISNAMRHARASRITVELIQEDGGTVLRVRDDGRGRHVPSDRPGGGVGLASMHERADRLGGRLRLADARTGGTELVLEVPRSIEGRPAARTAGSHA